MSKAIQKKIEEIKFLLEATQEPLVIEGLQKLEQFSNPALTESLLRAFAQNHSETTNQKILSLFCSASQKESLDILITALSSAENLKNRRHEVLGTLWQTRHNLSEHLPFFVEILINGNYLEAIECFTIIENLEPPFDPIKLAESVEKLTDEISLDKHPKDHLNILRLSLESLMGFSE
jgi:hypothetical protein